MTLEEAIENLKSILNEATTDENSVCYVNENDETTLKSAIKALEKQIPQNPIIKTNIMKRQVSAYCPICYTDIMYYLSEENYCHNCGQAIKWE